MADLRVALEDLRDSSLAAPGEPPASARTRRWARALVAGLAVRSRSEPLVAVAWRQATRPRGRGRSQAVPHSAHFMLAAGPTTRLSRSTGRTLAYSSDRSGEGNLDIWVQQIPDGSPVGSPARRGRRGGSVVLFRWRPDRLPVQPARRPASTSSPRWAAKSGSLAARGFFGGSPRMDAGSPTLFAEPAGGRIYVAPAAGVQLYSSADGLYRAQAPVWSPDGPNPPLWAQRRRDAAPEGNHRLVRGGGPRGEPARAHGGAQRPPGGGLRRRFRGCRCLMPGWVRGSSILFHGNVGDSSNLWQLAVSLPRPCTVTGTPRAGDVRHHGRGGGLGDVGWADGVRSAGRRGWTSGACRSTPTRGRVEGPLRRLTQDAADDYHPTLSDDGTDPGVPLAAKPGGSTWC